MKAEDEYHGSTLSGLQVAPHGEWVVELNLIRNRKNGVFFLKDY
jgi:hypothetical protein